MDRIHNGVVRHPDNPHYFLDQVTGKPLVLMGSTHHLPQRAGFRAEEAERQMVDDIARWKSNHGRLWHFTPWGLPGGDLMPWRRVEGHGHANDGRDRFDLDLWDETCWAHIRDVMRVAERHGVYLQIMLFDRCGISRMPSDRKERWYLNPYNPDNHVNDIPGLPAGNSDARAGGAFYDLANVRLMKYQEAYVSRMIEETAAFRSTIFEICNEYCDEEFEPGPSEWEEHWTAFVRKRCTNIVAANNLGSTDPPGTPDRYWANDDLDMVNWHTIRPREAYDRFVRFYDRGKALCHGEQAYGAAENTDRPARASAHDLRMVAWGAFFGGGHLSWDESNASCEHDDDRATMQVMQFVEDTGFDFVRARPAPDLSDRGWCMADAGREYAIYLPDGGDVQVRIPRGSEVEARWYQPETGRYFAAEQTRSEPPGSYRAPAEGDIVLHLSCRRT